MRTFRRDYLNRIFSIAINHVEETKLGKNKVINFIPPDQIKSKFDFNIHNKLDEDGLVDLAKQIADYSLHTGHPHYFNTLFGGINEFSQSAEYIASAVNSPMYTYESAPVFSIMEDLFYKYLGKDVLGWNEADGIFAPGGSVSNLYAFIVSRYFKNPDFKTKGLFGTKPLAIFTSELSHYSIKKAAIVCGYGLDNIYSVEADLKGRMIPQDLERQIQAAIKNGCQPLICNATLATTVFGAIDPLPEISEICKKHGLWLHVDACYGGTMLFVPEVRERLGSFENVDSIALDFHKVLNIQQSCSMFVTKHSGLLDQSNSTNAEYLFMKDKVIYDAKLDSGDKSIQCGRKNDVLKLFLYWKSLGTAGISDLIRGVMSNAKYMAEEARKKECFELLYEPEWVSVGFYYLPERLRCKERNEQFWKELDLVAPKIKAEMVRRGSMMIAYQRQTQKQKKYVNFIRPTLTVEKTKEDIDFMLSEIDDIGKRI